MVERVLETGTEDLLGYIDGAVAVLALNRPEHRNALSPGIYAGFGRMLPELAADDSIHVVVITGTGGAFSAGGDITAMHDRNQKRSQGEGPTFDSQLADLRSRQDLLTMAVHRLPQPVIAAIPGPVAGAGLSIALAADLRIAAESAVLVPAFSNIGASGDFGGSWFLSHLVGPAKARELYFFSPRLTANEALELGIVNRVVPDDGFDASALEWARTLADRPPTAMRLAKENMNRALTADLQSSLDAEALNMVRSMRSADHEEAVLAFIEKRPPRFEGR